MNDLRPGTIAVLAGGVVLLLASFLDWQGPLSAWDRGLTGFFLLVIAAVAIAVGAIDGFAPQVNLPESLLDMSRNQIVMMLGASTFIFSFSVLFATEGFKIGTILGVAASAAIAAGAYMENQAGGGTTSI